MLDAFLLSIQKSHFAFWLSQDAYPIILTLHSVGLALLVGLIAIIDLRVLGIGPSLPLASLRRYMTVVWIGFITNAITGTLLFCITPDKFYHSYLFRTKISLIVAGLILGAILNSSLLSVGNEYAQVTKPSGRQRTLAVLSLVCWTAAIFTGRWLAYTTFADIGVTDAD